MIALLQLHVNPVRLEEPSGFRSLDTGGNEIAGAY